MITSAVEYVQQGYMVRSVHSDPMNSYQFLSVSLYDDGTLRIKAVNFIKENSQQCYDPQMSDFATINLSDLQLDQFYKVSLRYEPLPPSTTYTNFMNLVKMSFIFKITRINNTYQLIGLPDNCAFDTQFYSNSIYLSYHVDPNNYWGPASFTYHNSIVRFEPISNDDVYYNNITFYQTNNYGVMSGSYPNVEIATIGISQGQEISFGNITFVVHNGQAEADFMSFLNYGSIPLRKFAPDIYYNISTRNSIGGGTTVWTIKVNSNLKVTEVYMDGVAQTPIPTSGVFNFDKYGNASSGGGSSSTGTNRLYLQIVKQWSPPKLSLNIDNNLKSYDNGWVNVDGAIRQIDKMWTNIDGVLKQV